MSSGDSANIVNIAVAYKGINTARITWSLVPKYSRSKRNMHRYFIFLTTSVYLLSKFYSIPIESKAWGMRSAERRKVNVLEMKWLRSFWSECHEWIEIGMKWCVGELE